MNTNNVFRQLPVRVSSLLPEPARNMLIRASRVPDSVTRQAEIEKAIVSIKRGYPHYFRKDAA